ncbi:MAG: hypothetical protein IJP23_03845 [Oscillospiraceae bacterium]|nr:hypothetical protein [Oscillospiraceae bacterium]
MAARSRAAGRDGDVEKALYRRAVGYEYQEDTYCVDSEDGQPVLTKRVVKHERPDVSAIKFWLQSRLPDKWGGASDEAEEEGGLVVLPEVKK